MSVRGVRGATTCLDNSKESITIETKQLLQAIFDQNSFEIEDICSILFSITDDLDALFPGWVARVVMGLDTVPIQDVQHFSVVGDLQRCIRVLIHVNTDVKQKDIRHVYSNDAKKLRPDLQNGE